MSAPRTVLRPAITEDAETVARLVAALLTELSGTDHLPAPDLARDVLSEPGIHAMLALQEGQAVGVMLLNECAAIYAGGRFGEITELYVLPALRSQGIAACLLAQAKAIARARGWHRLEVGAPAQPDWGRTLAFYQAQGFQEIGPRLRLLI
ncbi:GNAT family N-acetyltransferase [Gemmobacter denitrificans]|uniref:GNAT family N-acetyltransferase n=1 Tax=Gemmobacter denitrificans TaxID=3123040 RepID=A0ABU8BTV2_9RHOB